MIKTTANSKEYMKEYQRQKRAGINKPNMEKFKKNKIDQDKIIKLRLPKKAITHKPSKIPGIKKINTNSKIEDINYIKWCNSAETKRFYYFTVIGKTSRKDEISMWKDIKAKQEIINIATTIDSKLLKEMKENPLFLKQKINNQL